MTIDFDHVLFYSMCLHFKNKCGQVWSITGNAHSWLTQNKKELSATLFDLKVTEIHQN